MKDFRHIERNGYHAIDWPGPAVTMSGLLERFPEAVIGKFLVNTSYDSGFLVPSDSELQEGWHMVGQLAHSPRISRTSQIPHDQFDEWLVFERPIRVEKFETMVNYYGFTPIDFWDEKRERFWQQIADLKPVSVIGENDGLYLVSRDETLVESVLRNCASF